MRKTRPQARGQPQLRVNESMFRPDGCHETSNRSRDTHQRLNGERCVVFAALDVGVGGVTGLGDLLEGPLDPKDRGFVWGFGCDVIGGHGPIINHLPVQGKTLRYILLRDASLPCRLRDRAGLVALAKAYAAPAWVDVDECNRRVRRVTAVCGVFGWRDQPVGSMDLTGVHEILAPYGASETWSGEAGPCLAALGAHQRGRPHATQSALVVGAGGMLVACADAHLHRRMELARELGLHASSSDAALALAAYERWGPSLVDHLSGSFALAILDRRRGGLLLVRDHAGARYLAAYEGSGVLAFATTSLALTGFGGVGHDLDLDRAAEVMLLAYGTDRTFVRGVRSVLPGTAMWIDSNGVRSWRWWLTRELPIRDAGSLDAHAAELREVLEVAVRSTLAGVRSTGALLSGGLDSTSVVAVAAGQLAPEPLRSYTSVPPPDWSGATRWGWIPNERFAVEALAERHDNLEPEFVDVAFGPMFDRHEELWELGSAPVRNPLNMIWVRDAYERAAAAGIEVMLTGAAGNLAFSADGPRWLIELARRGRLRSVLREASLRATAFDRSPTTVLKRYVLAEMLPGLQLRWSARRGASPVADLIAATAIHPERLASMDLGSVLSRLTHPHPRGFTRDTGRMFANGAAQAETHGAMRVRYGIEMRDPTADRHLVELAVTQPEWWRRHEGIGRKICRTAMRDVLPPEIVDREMLGAQQPEWLDRLTHRRSELLDELDAMRDHPASCNVIDVAKLDRLAKAWPDRGSMASKQVVNDYQLALPRAIVLSRYLRWFEDRARRVRGGGPAVVVPARS